MVFHPEIPPLTPEELAKHKKIMERVSDGAQRFNIWKRENQGRNPKSEVVFRGEIDGNTLDLLTWIQYNLLDVGFLTRKTFVMTVIEEGLKAVFQTAQAASVNTFLQTKLLQETLQLGPEIAEAVNLATAKKLRDHLATWDKAQTEAGEEILNSSETPAGFERKDRE